MSKQLVVHKGRYNTITVNVGIDLTGDTITSQIRERPEQSSELIAEWDVTVTDDSAGLLTLVLDDSANEITASKGFMDIKRDSGGNPLPVFDEPLAVEFRGSVTA